MTKEKTEKKQPYHRFSNFFVPQGLIRIMLDTRYYWDDWDIMDKNMEETIVSVTDFFKNCYHPFYIYLWESVYSAVHHGDISYPRDAVLFINAYLELQGCDHPLHSTDITKLDGRDFLDWMDKAGKYFQSRIVPTLEWTCETVYEVYRELLCALWDMDISSTSWEGIYPEKLSIIGKDILPLTVSELRYVVENGVSQEDWLGYCDYREKELSTTNMKQQSNETPSLCDTCVNESHGHCMVHVGDYGGCAYADDRESCGDYGRKENVKEPGELMRKQ